MAEPTQPTTADPDAWRVFADDLALRDPRGAYLQHVLAQGLDPERLHRVCETVMRLPTVDQVVSRPKGVWLWPLEFIITDDEVPAVLGRGLPEWRTQYQQRPWPDDVNSGTLGGQAAARIGQCLVRQREGEIRQGIERGHSTADEARLRTRFDCPSPLVVRK